MGIAGSTIIDDSSVTVANEGQNDPRYQQ